MLETLEITNYRSIAKATVELRPFTLLVGANGSGKSNLLRLLSDLSDAAVGAAHSLTTHFNRSDIPTQVTGVSTDGHALQFAGHVLLRKPAELSSVRIFSIDPNCIGRAEPLLGNPDVERNGFGAIQVLDALKTGDREDLFDAIEAALHDFVPEIEKLSFVPGQNVKRLQVRERNIASPVLVSDLSEGTRLVLTILTIVYQVRKPSIICLEDIDRGIHPRLFGQIVDVCRRLVRDQEDTQIIATTHNPYLVDHFVDDEESVLVVEKVDSNTTFTKLSDKLAGLDAADESLGGRWYSGLVGGVPVRSVKHLKTAGNNT